PPSVPLLDLSLSFFSHTAPPELYTLSLHDALPICNNPGPVITENHKVAPPSREHMKTGMEELIHHFKLFTEGMHVPAGEAYAARSEEHTSELQSRENLVCRLLLEKKKRKQVSAD